MSKPYYGDPVVTLRLPREMVTAAKISARRHDTTLSGLVRSLIEAQLHQDGIDYFQPSKPLTGQKSIDDYLVEAEA